MVSAALDEVLRSGVQYGVEAVRIDKIIAMTDVPRGAAYGFWESDTFSAQDNLRRAVVLALLRDMPSGNALATRDIALEEIAAHPDVLGSGDAAAIRALLERLIRRGAKFNFESLNSPQWRVYRSIVTSATTQPDADPEILAAIREGEDRLLETYETIFTQFVETFEHRLRAGHTIAQFALCIYALNDGLANRISTRFQNQTVVLGDEEWTLFGVGFMALIDRFFVPK